MITPYAMALGLIGLFAQPLVQEPARAVSAAVDNPPGLIQPEVLPAGEMAMLEYQDVSKANSDVTVIVHNGKSGFLYEHTELHFSLDDEGYGVCYWNVPDRNWDVAFFQENEEQLFVVVISGN